MNTNTTKPLLSEQDTIKFLKQTDLACRLLDFGFLKEVLEKFELQDLNESADFLSAAKAKFSFWKESENIQILEVASFESKCIACSFGKSVNAYKIKYQKKDPVKKFTVAYERQIALNFEIVQNRLTDFAWCNAFLDKEEISEIKNSF